MQSRLNLKVPRLSKHNPLQKRICFFFNFTISQNDIMEIPRVQEIQIKAKGFKELVSCRFCSKFFLYLIFIIFNLTFKDFLLELVS